MKLFLEIYIVFCTLFHTSVASTIELSPRDTWVPRILFPHNGTTWRVDNHHNVTWDLTQQPAEISNPVGIIFLRRDGILFPTPLATGFQLTDGHAEIQVPDVEPASDYEIILVGNFDNASANFTITD